ncbi:transient receptor potential cation channel subfamily a member 1-like [Gigaspora margarita]|uniref:Transient receptor potential cation channel subfamily a member 1-like n=1 Tax=Gigaspora margarita TaxID=4874 RepID=A0A8H4A2T2_GIGMA|nr:transient receptor potential cation channel subfamily a member 1-like [Gigaspora margarita]
MFNDTINEIIMWDYKDLSAKTRILIEWCHILQHIEISDDEELLVTAIDRFHLIASQKGERLLFINISEKRFNLVDPYYFRNPIDANKLIYTIDGKLFIDNLVHDDWIEYLRNELKDTNSITTPSKMTIDLITKIIKSKYNPYRNEFEGKFLKWSLELNDESVKLILENDDFLTFTRIGIIIWTYNFSDIKMHYYWSDWNDRLENYVYEKIMFKRIIEDWTSGRILPISSYETILNNLNVKFGENKLFEEFLTRSIDDEFYLTCYGKDLMKTLISLNDDKWIRKLGQRCIDKCIQLLKSTSLHLSKYGVYYHLYNTSFADILTSILWDRWINFQHRFQNRFQMFQDNHPLLRDLIICIYSVYYLLDLIAILFTTLTSIEWLKSGVADIQSITFSILFLEIKFIIFFRATKFLGIYLAMIMKTVDKVISFLIIFGLFTFALAHSLHLLIGSESEISQDFNINMFAQFGSAVIASYYMMLTGDSTPISSWISNENIMIMFLMLIVSFFLLIYLMNLFIGILSNLISNEDSYVTYLTLKSEILEEIELLYMLPHQRRKENWFPSVFYECHTIKLREHIMSIQDKGTGYGKPYISKNLNEVVLLLEEQPSLKQIEGRIEGKLEMIFNQLSTLKEIEKKTEDLPTLKQDIKELKKSIEKSK